MQAFEAGDGLGGVWYWNRYPGARCDVDSVEVSDEERRDAYEKRWQLGGVLFSKTFPDQMVTAVVSIDSGFPNSATSRISGASIPSAPACSAISVIPRTASSRFMVL